jgi:hypothetical protein
MPHRNALKLDSSDNTAIRAKIGERLRVLLTKEQSRPPPRIQDVLDCLSSSNAAPGQFGKLRSYLSWFKPRGR